MSEGPGRLADIIGPAAPGPPPAPGHGWLIWAAALTICTAAVLVLWMRGARHRRTRRRLRTLQQAYRSGHLPGRELAYGVASELEHGFRLKRVTAERAPPGLDSARRACWADLAERLDALRYRPEPGVDPEETVRLALWMQARIGRRR